MTIEFAPKARGIFSPVFYKGMYGGRGGVKSHTAAGYCVIEGSRKSTRVMCLREYQNSIAQSAKLLIEDKIAAYDMRSDFEITKTEIKGRRSYNEGTLFVFLGIRRNPDAVKSHEGFDIAWLEEAETAHASSLDIVLPTIRKPGSQFISTWNPCDIGSAVDDLYRNKKTPLPPENSWIQKLTWRDNPWFSDELKLQLRRDRERDLDKYLWIWEGEYRKLSEARVFKNVRVGQLEKPDGIEFLHGADWGFGGDPTTLVRFWYDPASNVLHITAEAVAYGAILDDVPKLFRGVDPNIGDWPIVGDSASPGVISHLKRHGLPKMRGAKKGPGSVEDGVSWLQSVDIVIDPACKHAIAEFATYSYKVDPKTEDILPVLVDDNNHIIDPVRYASEGFIRGQGHDFW